MYRLREFLMRLILKIRGKSKPLYQLVPASADLDEGGSVQVQVLRNGVPGRVLSVSSSDPRFTAIQAGDQSQFVVAFVGPADLVNDIQADILVEVE